MRADKMLSEVAAAERLYGKDELVEWTCDSACKAYVRLFLATSRSDYYAWWREFRACFQKVRFAVEVRQVLGNKLV